MTSANHAQTENTAQQTLLLTLATVQLVTGACQDKQSRIHLAKVLQTMEDSALCITGAHQAWPMELHHFQAITIQVLEDQLKQLLRLSRAPTPTLLLGTTELQLLFLELARKVGIVQLGQHGHLLQTRIVQWDSIVQQDPIKQVLAVLGFTNQTRCKKSALNAQLVFIVRLQ